MGQSIPKIADENTKIVLIEPRGLKSRPRRDKMAIKRDILLAAQDGATKTRMVYQANLNFITIKPYIQELCLDGYLDPTIKGIYQTTPKGMSFVRRYARLEGRY
jgi:predicted transcriptional regulator